jgi:hypothetical protein
VTKKQFQSAAKLAAGVEDVKAIIVNRALYHFRSLSLPVQRRVDLEDWISLGLTFYCTTFAARASRKFNPALSSYNTYVYRAFDNLYRGYVWEHSFKHMNAFTSSIEELVGEGTSNMADNKAQDFVHQIDAVRKVRELHSRASTELVSYLDKHFFTCDHAGRVIVKGKQFQLKKQEFIKLAQRIGVTIDDYRTAIQMHQVLQSAG